MRPTSIAITLFGLACLATAWAVWQAGNGRPALDPPLKYTPRELKVSIGASPTVWFDWEADGAMREGVGLDATFVNHSSKAAGVLVPNLDIPRQWEAYDIEMVPLDGQPTPTQQPGLTVDCDSHVSNLLYVLRPGWRKTIRVRSRHTNVVAGRYSVRLRYKLDASDGAPDPWPVPWPPEAVVAETVSLSVVVTIPERPDRPQRLRLTATWDADAMQKKRLIAILTNTGDVDAAMIDPFDNVWYGSFYRFNAVRPNGSSLEYPVNDCGSFFATYYESDVHVLRPGESRSVRLEWPYNETGGPFDVRITYTTPEGRYPIGVDPYDWETPASAQIWPSGFFVGVLTSNLVRVIDAP